MGTLMRDIKEVSPYDYSTEADFNMIIHLLKNPRYNIPAQLRDKVINCINNIVTCIDDPKTQLAAVNTLVALDRCNIELIKIAMPKKVEHKQINKLSDEELLDALKEVQKKLPEVISHADRH